MYYKQHILGNLPHWAPRRRGGQYTRSHETSHPHVYEASTRKRDSKASSEIKERGHKICQIVRYALRHNYTPQHGLHTWFLFWYVRSQIRDVHAFRCIHRRLLFWVVVLVHLRHTFANIFWYGSCMSSFILREKNYPVSSRWVYITKKTSLYNMIYPFSCRDTNFL